MEFVDYKINISNVENNSVVLLFEFLDDDFININIQDAMFEKYSVYNKYLEERNKLSLINQFIIVPDIENVIYYFIQSINSSNYLKQFERNINNLRLTLLSYIYRFNLRNIYTYIPYDGEKKEIFINMFETFNKDINVKICKFDA